MSAGGWDDENDLQTVSQSWGDALDTLTQSPASLLPVDNNTELAVDLAMLSPVHGTNKASPPPARGSKGTRASRSQTAASAQPPLLAAHDTAAAAQDPALLGAASRSETAESTRRAQTRLLHLAGQGGAHDAIDASQGGADPIKSAGGESAGADIMEPGAKRQCVVPPTMPLRQGVLAVAASPSETAADTAARAAAASGGAGLAWAPEALQQAAASRQASAQQLLGMPGGVGHVGYPGSQPQGGYVPVPPNAGAHIAPRTMPWPQQSPSLIPGAPLAASYVSAGVRDTTAMAVAAGAARPDLLGLRSGAAQQPAYPVTAYGTVVGATLPVAAGTAAAGAPAAAGALPSIPVRLRDGGPDVPLGTPVVAHLAPAVGAAPHGILAPPPPAAGAALGYNPALPGTAVAQAAGAGAAVQLVAPEAGPPPQLGGLRFPQQYMVLQASGAAVPAGVADGEGAPLGAIDQAYQQKIAASATPTVVQVGGVLGADIGGVGQPAMGFPTQVAGAIPGAASAQHAVAPAPGLLAAAPALPAGLVGSALGGAALAQPLAQIPIPGAAGGGAPTSGAAATAGGLSAAMMMPRRAIKADRGTELEQNVRELKRQSQELRATYQMYQALAVAKQQARDEGIERIMAHLRDQRANLNMAANEVKELTRMDGTDVPLAAMMRWSALLGDDFQTAPELFQHLEFHQKQFSKALPPPEGIVRGPSL